MIVKRLICPERVRRIPAHFSWVDHRLVRDHYIDRCGPEALALYLFLVSVGDAEGLSYYSDTVAAKALSIDNATLRSARRELIQADLIAYQNPLYQVLNLKPVMRIGGRERANECLSLREALHRAVGGEP